MVAVVGAFPRVEEMGVVLRVMGRDDASSPGEAGAPNMGMLTIPSMPCLIRRACYALRTNSTLERPVVFLLQWGVGMVVWGLTLTTPAFRYGREGSVKGGPLLLLLSQSVRKIFPLPFCRFILFKV